MLFRHYLVSFLLVAVARLWAQDADTSIAHKILFGKQLLFIERRELGNINLIIAEVKTGNSADTVYLDTINLSNCTTWELLCDRTAGVWELNHDTLTVQYYRESTLRPDAGYYDPPLIQSWQKQYVIRKNMQVVCVGIYYAKNGVIIDQKLDQEISRKTANVKFSCW